MKQPDRRPKRGRPPASDQQRQLQRLDISRYAVRLFREQGVSATSGEQIARAAGISERTLWRLFRTKESCVEPLLAKSVEAFERVLRTWPLEVDLTEHLRAAYMPVMASENDVESVLAVIRMTHDEPALRAIYLLLRERAEPAFAEVLAKRMGMSPDALEVRMQAAATSAALREATDQLVANTNDDGKLPEDMQDHRDRVADALSRLTHHPV